MIVYEKLDLDDTKIKWLHKSLIIDYTMSLSAILDLYSNFINVFWLSK